ncbi:MAG: Uma2 family endonuclease, partial [Chloroflexi bacterium]|nr:Uma2 family endonuclease [Chloroflexota bacterium]
MSTLLELPPADAQHPWPAQGKWTYEDYLRLPDDGRRYEIIEGVLYVTNPPSYEHQFTSVKLASQLDRFVSDSQMGIVLTAPFEVHLPGIARPVQPDLLFIASARQPRPGDASFEGVPDLIVEVQAAETLRLDYLVKFVAYERTGVREYWLANPKTHAATVHYLPEGGQEYILHGQFGPADTLTSPTFPGLAL